MTEYINIFLGIAFTSLWLLIRSFTKILLREKVEKILGDNINAISKINKVFVKKLPLSQKDFYHLRYDVSEKQYNDIINEIKKFDNYRLLHFFICGIVFFLIMKIAYLISTFLN